MSKPVINVEHLSKRYKLGALHQRYIRDNIARLFKPKKTLPADHEILALSDISFQADHGDILGIIGVNGSGKSTLLKILAGISKPTAGNATIYGRVRTLLEVGTGFHPELTGRENIYLNGSVLGMKKNEITKKFDEIVDFSGVHAFINTPIKRYSSGMQLRLAFAVAAFLESEILFADEVLAVGDIEFQRKCLGKMSEFVKEGRTILFVSHQMSAIRALCNKVMWLEKGKIMDIGACNEVANRYEKKQLAISHKPQNKIFREHKTDNLHIKSISLMDTEGNYQNTFKYKSNLILILEISGSTTINSYGVKFSICGEIDANMHAHTILSIGSSNLFHNQYFLNNTKKICINIGPLMLSNSDYSITLSLVAADQTIDTWEKACRFKIIECHPFTNGNDVYAAGCILPHTFSLAD